MISPCDTPERLKAFAQRMGYPLRGCCLLLRPDPAHKQALFDRMEVAVNYDAQGVNVHGIQLLLLDRHGRYVRSYHSVIWENAKVLRDLKQLLTEARS